jgi:hypothetical protein
MGVEQKGGGGFSSNGGVDQSEAQKLHFMIENLTVSPQAAVDNLCVKLFGTANPMEIAASAVEGPKAKGVKKSSEIIW